MNLSQAQIPLAITSGEPAGIGLDVCLGLMRAGVDYPVEILADFDALADRAEALGMQEALNSCLKHACPKITLKHIAAPKKIMPGCLEVANVPYVLNLLDTAIAGVETGQYAGIVTAPIHKGIINDSGLVFSGHTEYFQHKAKVKRVVMMLSDRQLNVALVTTHLPLSQVPKAITSERITEIVTIIHHDFKQRFKIASPRIAMAGLNPHAGENGYLGREELDIIIPTIKQLQLHGYLVSGPYPADTIFNPHLLASHDVILAMYHDQGLPVIKFASFGNAVNITLGLPYVRTSVDHGTALDLAASGQANPDSLIKAIQIASDMI